MPVINFEIKGLELLTTLYPNRIKWAIGEAMKMTGGHEKKLLRKFIETGGPGWPGLNTITRKLKQGPSSPLFNLGKMAKWKYTGGANPRVQVGFFFQSKMKGSQRRAAKGRYVSYFGKGEDSIFLKHEEGADIPVTTAMQRSLAGLGIFVRKGTILHVPARPMIGPFWEREKELVPAYVHKRFWEKMAVAQGQKQ
jgi:hypothetical protein